jgi:hypothetical protein
MNISVKSGYPPFEITYASLEIFYIKYDCQN